MSPRCKQTGEIKERGVYMDKRVLDAVRGAHFHIIDRMSASLVYTPCAKPVTKQEPCHHHTDNLNTICSQLLHELDSLKRQVPNYETSVLPMPQFPSFPLSVSEGELKTSVYSEQLSSILKTIQGIEKSCKRWWQVASIAQSRLGNSIENLGYLFVMYYERNICQILSKSLAEAFSEPSVKDCEKTLLVLETEKALLEKRQQQSNKTNKQLFDTQLQVLGSITRCLKRIAADDPTQEESVRKCLSGIDVIASQVHSLLSSNGLRLWPCLYLLLIDIETWAVEALGIICEKLSKSKTDVSDLKSKEKTLQNMLTSKETHNFFADSKAVKALSDLLFGYKTILQTDNNELQVSLAQLGKVQSQLQSAINLQQKKAQATSEESAPTQERIRHVLDIQNRLRELQQKMLRVSNDIKRKNAAQVVGKSHIRDVEAIVTSLDKWSEWQTVSSQVAQEEIAQLDQWARIRSKSYDALLQREHSLKLITQMESQVASKTIGLLLQQMFNNTETRHRQILEALEELRQKCLREVKESVEYIHQLNQQISQGLKYSRDSANIEVYETGLLQFMDHFDKTINNNSVRAWNTALGRHVAALNFFVDQQASGKSTDLRNAAQKLDKVCSLYINSRNDLASKFAQPSWNRS